MALLLFTAFDWRSRDHSKTGNLEHALLVQNELFYHVDVDSRRIGYTSAPPRQQGLSASSMVDGYYSRYCR